jgi:hypothetical protein
VDRNPTKLEFEDTKWNRSNPDTNRRLPNSDCVSTNLELHLPRPHRALTEGEFDRPKREDFDPSVDSDTIPVEDNKIPGGDNKTSGVDNKISPLATTFRS